MPKNNRTITYFSTMYKFLTSVVTERTYNFLDVNNILPSEQKECKNGSYGCKDQLLLNKMLLENSRSCNRYLSTAWIDFRKAFDSVPHTWILKVFQMHKIFPTIVNFLTTSLIERETNLYLNHSQGNTICKNIKIKCGIFQGDSMSPLVFCLALVPVTRDMDTTYTERK